MYRRSVARSVGSLVGIAGVAFSITLLSQSMRSVQAVGGFCASGGPYQIRQQCPKGIAGTFPLAIVGGLIFLAIFSMCASERGRSVVMLAWPALFLTLGWNFLDYGLHPAGNGSGAGFLVCAAVFGVMGAVPLVWVVPNMLKALGPDDDSTSPTTSPWVGAMPTSAQFMRPTTAPAPWTAPAAPRVSPTPTPTGGVTTTATPTGGLATEFERLASLHRRGELTDAEYEAAKQQALHSPGGST